MRLPLAEIHRRNVHVFNSSNGAELAGLTDVTVRLLSTPGRVNINVHRLDQSTMLHSYQMGSVPMPVQQQLRVGGAALDSGNRDELQPGHYVILPLPPGELLHVFCGPCC